MDTKIYFNKKRNSALITSDFTEWQKQVDLGIVSTMDFEVISIKDFLSNSIKGVTFEDINERDFQKFKFIFHECEFEYVCFRRTNVDLTETVITVKHVIIDESNINIESKNFINLNEISFLSLKKFRGQVIDNFKSVRKLVIWYENKKSHELLPKFPDLDFLRITNASSLKLDLTNQPKLQTLELYRCIKLLEVNLHPNCILRRVIVKSSKKLDVSNLGEHVLII